jgi:hypothetical protein
VLQCLLYILYTVLYYSAVLCCVGVAARGAGSVCYLWCGGTNSSPSAATKRAGMKHLMERRMWRWLWTKIRWME